MKVGRSIWRECKHFARCKLENENFICLACYYYQTEKEEKDHEMD